MRMSSIGCQEKFCPDCKSLPQGPVQLTCGHSFCRSCKTDLIPPEKLFSSTYGNEQKELTQLCMECFSGRRVTGSEPIFKSLDKCHICPKCKLVLRDAVQPACGHQICQSCADEILAKETSPCCPECGEVFDNEDGAYYLPDRFVRKEIKNLVTICPFFKMGCTWEGKFEEYQQHVKECIFTLLACEHCREKVRGDQMERHTASCPCVPKKCPLATIGCSENPPQKQSDLQNHLQRDEENHLTLLVRKIALLQEVNEQPQTKHDTEQSLKKRAPIHTQVQDMMQRSLQEEVMQTLMAELRSKDDEIASLKATVTRLEKKVKSKSAKLEDRDFRLSLIENSNHDGSMIWKIPQFSQRKADAENGKYTSIFSLPFYTGRYGYKMCLRLYIMGDGIGKGTHLSLFFVVMRGEFDNILQWPFTHKVTFKLINQAGGRDIVDTFQPDPMSSSFRKPKSDMNIASGCPRFVSHTELERGGFIVDDTIFIKSVIDVSSIRHP